MAKNGTNHQSYPLIDPKYLRFFLTVYVTVNKTLLKYQLSFCERSLTFNLTSPICLLFLYCSKKVYLKALFFEWNLTIPTIGWILQDSVPTDRRSFRTGPKKILEDRSVQDLIIAKRTSKDLFLNQELLLGFSKWIPWNFNDKSTWSPLSLIILCYFRFQLHLWTLIFFLKWRLP